MSRCNRFLVIIVVTKFGFFTNLAPTTSCRTSVGVAVLDGFLYAVGGQDGVQCLNHVERYDPKGEHFTDLITFQN